MVVTTQSSGQMLMLGVALVVAVLLAPALVYAHSWLRALKQSRAQQARRSRRRGLVWGCLSHRESGPRAWAEGQTQSRARATDPR